MGYLAGVRSRFSLRVRLHELDDAGSMLVEVMVASLILLLVFTGVVQQISNLATARVRIETRDRAVSYANSLQEIMGANGCGFDVDTVEETLFKDELGNYIPSSSDSFAGSDQIVLRGPWGRIQGCAFNALENVRETPESDRIYSYVDVNDVVHLTANQNGTPSDAPIEKSIAAAFCKQYGEAGSQYSDVSCELGDQTFVHKVNINDDGTQTNFKVSVNFWFEIVGGNAGVSSDGINQKSSCNQIVDAGRLPDTLARRVQVSFPSGNGQTETITITKRENVPIDSFQFASGTRVAVAVNSGDGVSMYPTPGLDDPWKVTRIRQSSTSCIWFPYISRHDAGERQPTFSIDGAGAVEATLTDIPALETGTL